jgi:hypothetical protein
MPGFDIEKLLDFEPPRFRCYHCRALVSGFPWGQYDRDLKCLVSACPECRVEYHLYHYQEGEPAVIDFLKAKECSIEFADLSGHAKDLARIARQFNTRAHNEFITYTPLKALLHALTLARRFVHFTSFGLSPFMLGILTAVAQRVNIDGVVSIISAGAANAITLAKNYHESIGSRLELRALGGEYSNLRLPHQKLVVIDGLIAFKGSANLTDYAWNNAEESLELIEVVTDVHEVTRLNNLYFSPVWLRASGKDHPPTYVRSAVGLEFSEHLTIEGIDALPGEADYEPWREFDLPLKP